jgi:ABC-type lipoprotein export system ATPase subunit
VSHTQATAPLVDLRGIGRKFGADPPVLALRDVDLQVHVGEWLSIAGPSGSGKSTLLHILGCLDRQSSGTYTFDGVDVAALTDDQRAGLRSRSIGFAFQAFHLLAHRNVLENVMLAEIYRDVSADGRVDRAMEVLTRVGLEQRAEFLPTHLSGGERQRTAIARALLGTPRLLLCDEPTGNLDTAATAGLLDLLAALNDEGLTLVLITHDADVAARASRRARILDGVLRETG